MGAQAHVVNIEYHRPWLYEKQKQAIFGPERIACVEASTKSGKTVSCIAWLVEQAMLGGGNGKNYWWVAPVGTQADIAFNRTTRFLPQGTFSSTRIPNKVVLLNGAILWFKGADRPDSLYGDDVHAAVIDEASRMKEDAWHAVRSTLTYTQGRVRIIGNVKGRKNWFYSLSRKAEEGRDKELGFHRIDAYDAVDAGVLKRVEIESAKRDLPENVFRELYLAQPSDDGGNPFGAPHIDGCIAPLSDRPPHVWGWDLAKKQDFTVGIALDQVGYVCRFERFQHVPWPDVISRIKIMTGGTPALVDSTGVGDPIVDELQRTPGSRFEGYHFSPGSKQKLMEGLAVAIQSRSITYPDGPIPQELHQFEYEYTRTGVRYTVLEGLHDDCVCALSLAVMARATMPQAVVFTKDLINRINASGRRRQ